MLVVNGEKLMMVFIYIDIILCSFENTNAKATLSK
jgi:hypothetical protein